ncbi:MAG TPA: hypothetical protein PLY76_10155 [Flavobacteriales bacterium]|nr:hypothetical protein [Flavobacteriales bacterium]HRP82253.1 hypothetical protein [Flavobacteriales bacterium]
MKQKTATGAKDPRHLSSIAPTVAHVADATKVGNNHPFRASIPDGYTAKPGRFTTPGSLLMAIWAVRRWPDNKLTKADWGKLLHQMHFAPSRLAEVTARLCECYSQKLGFDDWADLFEQLAAEHVLATKYPHLV